MCIGLGEHSAVLDAFRGDRKNGKPWTTWARHGLPARNPAWATAGVAVDTVRVHIGQVLHVALVWRLLYE
jgi:hypothetical protein